MQRKNNNIIYIIKSYLKTLARSESDCKLRLEVSVY